MILTEKLNDDDIDETLQDIIEDLVDTYADTKQPITRLQIGLLLRDYDLNTPKNMKTVIQKLNELNIPIT